MIRVNMTELRKHLSKYLRRVKQGETVEITERSVVIARIQGVTRPTPAEEHLDRLEREGVLLRPRREPDRSVLDLVPIPCSANATRILIEERDER